MLNDTSIFSLSHAFPPRSDCSRLTHGRAQRAGRSAFSLVIRAGEIQLGRETGIFNDGYLIGLLLDRRSHTLSIYVHGRLRCTVPKLPSWGPLYPAVCVLDRNQRHELVPPEFDLRSAPKMEVGARRVRSYVMRGGRPAADLSLCRVVSLIVGCARDTSASRGGAGLARRGATLSDHARHALCLAAARCCLTVRTICLYVMLLIPQSPARRVTLAGNYEEFGDAERGPLKPGLEGLVTEVGPRDGSGASSQKIRVAMGRAPPWWYDREALRVVRAA